MTGPDYGTLLILKDLDPLTFLLLKFDNNEQILQLFLTSYTTTFIILNLNY